MSTLTTGQNGQSKPRELSLTVDATNMCQLNCRYCYYGAKGNRLMDVQKVFAGLMNFILSQENVGIITLHYMGGEPLLAWPEILRLNQLVRDFCDQQELNFRWGLTSNLIALDEAKAEHMIKERAGIHCSIDGPAHIHNRNRPYCGGQPSFDDVVKNVPLALAITPQDTGRVTVCPDASGELPLIAETLIGLGFKSVGIYPAPNEDWTEQSVQLWGQSLQQAFQQNVNLPIGRMGIRTLINGFEVKEEFTYCGAGKGLWAFDVNGCLYHCHHFTNSPELAIINAAQASANQILRAVSGPSICPVKIKPPEICQRCPALNFCNGGCWAYNYCGTGNANQPNVAECRLRAVTAEAVGSFFITEPSKGDQVPLNACGNCYSCQNCYQCIGCERCQRCDGYCDSCQKCYSCESCLTCQNCKGCDSCDRDVCYACATCEHNYHECSACDTH